MKQSVEYNIKFEKQGRSSKCQRILRINFIYFCPTSCEGFISYANNPLLIVQKLPWIVEAWRYSWVERQLYKKSISKLFKNFIKLNIKATWKHVCCFLLLPFLLSFPHQQKAESKRNVRDMFSVITVVKRLEWNAIMYLAVSKYSFSNFEILQNTVSHLSKILQVNFQFSASQSCWCCFLKY